MPIAILFMFVALALITPTLMHGIQQNNQLIMGTVAAKQLHQVTAAAKGYITAYAGAIEGQATATTPATITVSMLVNTGFLPQGFQAGNPYGQTWEVQVLQPQPGNLQALVLSQGGTPIQPADAPRIASESGAEGGTINVANNTAQGSYGGWSVSMNGYANPGAGHLTALVAYSNGQLQSDYLYRVAVPGQPQLNTMQTNLDMGNNNINNAHDVQAGPVGQCVTDASGHCMGEVEAAGTTQADLPPGWQGGMTTRDLVGVNGTVGEGTGNGAQPQAYLNDYGNGTAGSGGQVAVGDPANGNYVDINSAANTGAAAPEIYTNGIIDAGTGMGSNYFATFNGAWWANNSGSSSQTGNAYVGGQVQANYDATLGTAYGGANIGWGCGPNGSIAANANGSGQILSCQGGTWQAMGGSGLGLTSGSPVAEWPIADSGVVGPYKFCTVSGLYVGGAGGGGAVWPVSGPYNGDQYDWELGGQPDTSGSFSCYN